MANGQPTPGDDPTTPAPPNADPPPSPTGGLTELQPEASNASAGEGETGLEDITPPLPAPTRANATTWKERLSARFSYSPFIQILIFNPWFRLVLIVFLTGAVLGLVSFLRIWVVTPPGVVPEIRISWLDWVRSQSFRRAARKYARDGQPREEAQAWRLAVANHPGDAGLLRESLDRLLSLADDRPASLVGAAGTALWLVRLGGANSHDLTLAFRLFERCELFDLIATIGGERTEALEPEAFAVYAKALFRVGRMEDFASAVPRARAGGTGEGSDLGLYINAWERGWGPPGRIEEGGKALNGAALAPGPRQVLANRLQIHVALRIQDPTLSGEALRRLQALHSDALTDHFAHWRVLRACGRTRVARGLAETFPGVPQTPWEAAALAEAQKTLGLDRRARDVLSRYAPEFGDGTSDWCVTLWAMYADALLSDRAWEDVRGLAMKLRFLPGAAGVYEGFSYYLEARADRGVGRNAEAGIAFERAVAKGFPAPGMALKAALELIEAGRPELASRLLDSIESGLARDTSFWQARFDVAYASRDGDKMLLAAEKAHTLSPLRADFQNNYAAALLIKRVRAEQAAVLTFELLRSNPASASARLNHAMALVQNRRFAEAGQLLSSLKPLSMGDAQRTFYNLCLLEMNAASGNWDRAAQNLKGIQEKHLFPEQIRWVQGKRSEIESTGSRR